MLNKRIATVRLVRETGKRTKYGYLRPEKFSIYCQVLGLNGLKTGFEWVNRLIRSSDTNLSLILTHNRQSLLTSVKFVYCKPFFEGHPILNDGQKINNGVIYRSARQPYLK